MTYLQPLLFVFGALALAGLLPIRRLRRRPIALCGVIGLLLVSWPPADWLFGRLLEARYPVRPFQPPPGIQALVVLGSAFEPPEYERPYPLPDQATFGRCEHAAWLYRTYGPLPVLACEGRLGARGPSVMGELLRRGGVPEEMIWVERESRSTYENALYGSAILRSRGVRRIVLVVEAQSMPRAAACFRKQGIDVICSPSSFRTLGAWTEELLPAWTAVRRNELTLHELVGLAVYRWRGWI